MKYCDINVFVLVKSSFPERVFLGEADYHGCIPETGIIISPLPPNQQRTGRGCGSRAVIITYYHNRKNRTLPERGSTKTGVSVLFHLLQVI
jgi:hypothetical protein